MKSVTGAVAKMVVAIDTMREERANVVDEVNQ